MHGINMIDFESEEFTRQVRGALVNCHDRFLKSAPCSHGRGGAALQEILGVPIKRARDLYHGRTTYTRSEAIALLEHVGLSVDEMAERCKSTVRADSAQQSSPERSHQLGHSLAMTVWNHADDKEFVTQTVTELLLAAENDPRADLASVALQALLDLSFGLRERFPGYRDGIPSFAIVGADHL